MNRRVRKSILKDAGMPPQHVGELMPPDIKPMVKEYHVGRNDPCPCGVGFKYKDCCLSLGTYENYK
jgi:hypothetical protein